MEYTRLGRSGLWVSKICLGTAGFTNGSHAWGAIAEKDAYRIMDAALERGINFFDTANVYGGPETRGMSEEIIGRWFKQGGRRRERVVLATKVGRVFERDDTDGPNNREGLSLYKIRRHLEASMKRLQVDHIELYHMHKHDQITSWDEVWEGFEREIRAGKLDYVGASNHDAWELVKAQACAARRGFMGLVCEQHLYTPLNRLAELEMLPMAMDAGLGITVFSPLFRGLLGIDMDNPDKYPRTAEAEFHYNHLKPRLQAYADLCKELGESTANITLAWELNHPAVNAVIIAPHTVESLDEMLGCLDVKLTDEALARIDEIFPKTGELNPYLATTKLGSQTS